MARKVLFDDGNVAGFLTPKGIMHATEAEALAEENEKVYEARVQLFIDSKIWNRGQDTRARALITEFLAFEDTLEDLEAAIAEKSAELEALREEAKKAANEARKASREARDAGLATAAPEVPEMPDMEAA